MYIAELHRKLMEAQERYNDKVRPYMASVRCQKDIESLSNLELNPEDISRSLDLSISFVKSRMAKINEKNAAKRRFLATGHIQELEIPGVFTIYQR